MIEKEVDGKLVKVDQPPDIYDADPDKEKDLLEKGLKIFRKTLQMNYFIRGDEVYPGEDEVNQDARGNG